MPAPEQGSFLDVSARHNIVSCLTVDLRRLSHSISPYVTLHTVQTALELLAHAIDAEDKHDYTEAYAQYMAALDYLMAAQQCMYWHFVVPASHTT